MIYKDFKQWCHIAVSMIGFPPDRKRVAKELEDHMTDHFEALLELGIDAEQAKSQTLEAMGDATELAPVLAAIHRPFWGWCLRVTRWLLLVLRAATVVSLCFFKPNTRYSQPKFDRFDPYTDTYLSDEKGVTERIFYREPGHTVKLNGYTLTLTKAAWTRTEYIESTWKYPDTFHFQIEITNPLPWSEEPELLMQLWAKDSNGKIYYPMNSGRPREAMYGCIYHPKVSTWLLDMELDGFTPEGVQWIEIFYNRDGKEFCFRVPLSGGAAS